MAGKNDKPELSSGGRIYLEGLYNTRDLGGIRTMDGRQILPGRLIRSGTLYEAVPGDIAILVHRYNLGTVVDFRTATERSQKPDPEIEGVINIFNPILDEETVGITFGEKEETGKTKPDALAGMLEHAAALGDRPQVYIDQLYEDLVLNDYASAQYGRFFDILLEADERAVLWHCTAGKDRVGVGTALLLTALGVDRGTVVRDFVKTNDFVMESALKTAEMVREKMKDDRLADCVKVLLSVSEDYICHAFDAMERVCGTAEAYLEERIGLDSRKLEALRERFLTQPEERSE